MGQYHQIQTRKAISSYGGVGSIIETREGSIIINNFDEWPFFQGLGGNFEEHNIIVDKRFKNRLSKYFQELEYLVKIPINNLNNGYKLDNQIALLSAKYFPKWFYCSNCKRFDKIDNWKKKWENNVEPQHKDYFYPPKCCHCYVKGRDDKKRKFYDLEQVRFILTAPNGEIADIPWDKWALFNKKKKESKDSENEDNIITLSSITVPDNLVLKYKTSDKLDDLKGIGIRAEQNGNKLNYTTLSGLFNLRIKIQELFPNTKEKDIEFKPVIRSSNSVYYPNILSSIYIPANDELNEFTINLIKENYVLVKDAKIVSGILKANRNIEIDADTIQKLIDNNFSVEEYQRTQTENEYRFDEYKFITNKENINIENNLIFNKVNNDFFQKDLIKSIFKMDKIKIISVQTSYTRQEPISTNSYLVDEDIEKQQPNSIIKKFTSKEGISTKHLPAIESYGEGIFFEFDNDILNKWIEDNPQVMKRIQTIIDNHNGIESSFNEDLILTPKYILIHTFSHLIIKELEYLAGYPATSLQERLYVDDNEDFQMNGVLIYTIAGSEGSYGGITSICDDKKIGKLIQSAMMRAKDCATDPICYHTNGQGVGNLNLSACFSCSLLPETSCEMFNCYLDRRILVDEKYGYFKNLINIKREFHNTMYKQ